MLTFLKLDDILNTAYCESYPVLTGLGLNGIVVPDDVLLKANTPLKFYIEKFIKDLKKIEDDFIFVQSKFIEESSFTTSKTNSIGQNLSLLSDYFNEQKNKTNENTDNSSTNTTNSSNFILKKGVSVSEYLANQKAYFTLIDALKDNLERDLKKSLLNFAYDSLLIFR